MEEDNDQVSEDESSANQRVEPSPAATNEEEQVKVIDVDTAPEKVEREEPAVSAKPPVHPEIPAVEAVNEKAEEKVDEPEREPEPKYNVVELLTKGGSLRFVFNF